MKYGKAEKAIITAGLAVLLSTGVVFSVSAASVNRNESTAEAASVESARDTTAEAAAAESATGSGAAETAAESATGSSQTEAAAESATGSGAAETAAESATGSIQTEAAAENATGSGAAEAAAESTMGSSTAETAEESAKSPEVVKAQEAFIQFLDGSKTVTCRKESIETNGSDVKNLLEEGKEYTYQEFLEIIQAAEQKIYEMSNEEGSAKPVKAEYAFLEDGISPMMALRFKTEEELRGVDVYFIFEYDEDTDKIDIAMGRDAWSRGFTRINTAGIVVDYGTYSAFESYYAYFQAAGGGKVNHIYSVMFDNRRAALSDLSEWEQETYICSYSIPKGQENSVGKEQKKDKAEPEQEKYSELNTLHRFLSGDGTFVIEPDRVFDRESNRAVGLYEQDGYTISDNSTVIGAISARCAALKIGIEKLFAGEPEWTVCK